MTGTNVNNDYSVTAPQGASPEDSGFIEEVNTTQQELTTFVDTTEISSVGEEGSTSYQPAYSIESIIDWLKRPQRFMSLTWVSGALSLGPSVRTSLPNALLSMPIVWNKINQFRWFKADMVVQVRINSTKFHCGRAMLVWKPLNTNYRTPMDRNALRINVGPWDNHSAASGFMNLSISPTSGSVYEMRIPWLYPIDAFDLNPSPTEIWHSLGDLDWYIFAPLGSPDGTNVEVNFYGWFENVELAGYHGLSPLPPSVVVPDLAKKPSLPLSIKNVSAWYPAKTTIETTVKVKSQAGKRKEQVVGSGSGIISGIAGAVGTVAGALGFGPVSMVAQGISSIAGMLGFSRPRSLKSEEKVSMDVGNFASVYQVDPAKMISLSQDNAVDCVLERYHTTPDDYFLSSLSAVPTFLGSITIDSTAKIGELARLGVTPVCARYANASLPDHVGNEIETTLLSYVALPFRYWRGNITYHFDVVASAFHSLRLMVAWVPQSVYTSMSSDILTNCINKVVDVNGDMQFDFVVPYQLPTEWATHNSFTKTLIHRDKRDLPEEILYNGMLVIWQLTDVMYPDKNPPPVTILVSISGQEMQYALPFLSGYDGTSAILNPWYLGYPLEGQIPGTVKVKAQSGVTEIPPQKVQLDLMGESVESISQLCGRPVETKLSVVAHALNPWLNPSTKVANSQLDGMEWRGNPLWDWITWWSQIFVGKRGSMNVKYKWLTEPPLVNVTLTPTIAEDDEKVTINWYSNITGYIANAFYGAGSAFNSKSQDQERCYGLPYFTTLHWVPNSILSFARSFEDETFIVSSLNRDNVVGDLYPPSLDVFSSDQLSPCIYGGDDLRFVYRIGSPVINGYDAHSGPVPPPLTDTALNVLPGGIAYSSLHRSPSVDASAFFVSNIPGIAYVQSDKDARNVMNCKLNGVSVKFDDPHLNKTIWSLDIDKSDPVVPVFVDWQGNERAFKWGVIILNNNEYNTFYLCTSYEDAKYFADKGSPAVYYDRLGYFKDKGVDTQVLRWLLH